MNRFVISTIFCAVALVLGAGNVASAEEPEQEGLHIEAQPLSSALREFSEQTGLQIGYAAELARGKETEGVAGVEDPTLALNALLASTGLEHRFVNAETVVIRASDTSLANQGVSSDSGNSWPALSQVLMAQNQTPAEKNQTSRRTETESDEDEKKRPIEEIIVTGTNIRGIAPDSSPVLVFDREDIQISGAATAQDFIQTLTTNFGGGANADLAGGLPNDLDAQRNKSFGSSVNLHGLGSGSTLVLLNGHRLAPSSTVGDITDISMIPVSAIDRVEVLTDGASSIYGSDAVAGVVNFILLDDFDGVETSFRYGVATQHRSAEEFRAGATGGLNWDSGHALLSYEYFNQDNLSVEDRSFSQNALPPSDLLPSQKRHSVLATISQDLSSDLEVFADVTYSRREAHRGSRTNLVGNPLVEESTSKMLSVAAGGTWKVSDSWFLDFSGTYGNSSILRNTTQPTSVTSQEFDSDIWTSDIKLSGTVIRLPGGDLKLAFGGHFRTEDFTIVNALTGSVVQDKVDRDVYAAFGEVFIPIVGPDNAVPGITRLELNLSGRYDHYSDFGSTANPKVGVLWSPVGGLRLRGSYGTSFNPPPIGLPKLTFVTAFNSAFWFPLFGITPADPSLADIVFLSVFGLDENLGPEESRAFTAGMDFDYAWNGHEIAFSTTWFDIDFDDRLGTTPLPFGTSFDVPNIAFNNPGAFPPGTVIFAPTMDQISAVVDSADVLGANIPPLFGDPFDAAIIDFTGVTRNLSQSIVSGLDFSVSYTYDSGDGALNFGIDGTYLLDFKQQATSATPVVSLVNTQYNPVDLKLRGHAGYSNNGFAANLFVNYVNDYKVSDDIDAARIESWTTVDLSLSYDMQQRWKGALLNDTIFRLSVINLFDQDPPSAPINSGFQIVGYDPTNASPLGRFIALQVTKRF